MNKISWWQPEIGKHEYKLIKSVLDSNFPNEGKFTTEFEARISSILKVRYVLAVTSATAAMFLALKALKIGPGDEVIVPDITFIATANAVEMTGAKAVLVDVDPNTLTIDINSLLASINKLTKAIIPVHVSGRGANLSEIITIARKNKLYVVEDAAEAFMSKYKGKSLGTLGQVGVFSLSPAKTITTGQGGLIVTNSNKLYKSLKELKDQGRPKRGTGGDDIHYSLGFNFKFTDLQAAVGIGQLNYLEKRIIRMKRNYTLYKRYLKSVNQVRVMDFNIEDGEFPQWTDIIAKKRDNLESYLKKNNIDSRKFWHPIHSQAYYKMPNSKFPNSTSASRNALWLPSGFNLKDADIRRVCKCIEEFYSNEKHF